MIEHEPMILIGNHLIQVGQIKRITGDETAVAIYLHGEVDPIPAEASLSQVIRALQHEGIVQA